MSRRARTRRDKRAPQPDFDDTTAAYGRFSFVSEEWMTADAGLLSRISRGYISAALTSATPQSASARRLRGHQLLLPRL